METFEALPSIARVPEQDRYKGLGTEPREVYLTRDKHIPCRGTQPVYPHRCWRRREEYIPHLEEALNDDTKVHDAAQPDISDIILTHKHHDHCFGLPSILSLLHRRWDERNTANPLPFQPPRIHKIPLPSSDPKLQSIIDSLAPGSFTPAPSGDRLHDLCESQTLPVTTTSAESQTSFLRILHTPGHTRDSMCIFYPEDRALFTADTVLGHGSAVFEDLASYMASLRKMINFGKGAGGEPTYVTVYPGHGPVVANGLRQVSMYLQHRVDREEQILKVLQRTPAPEEPWTTWSVVSTIYADYPPSLWEPAAHSVELHMRKLESEGRVECLGGAGKNTQWELVH
ncbi:Beta-lactamase-like protein 2 [Grifola frondosa]|uniref:Beta-lactamase-like protein 2 n=1 Tax=Grifola frondosa TaxID=5627 RepID=A0A1C7MF17_GRIFR|nr:Beta-lactamase-like protein 2 [Grifola frondosa]